MFVHKPLKLPYETLSCETKETGRHYVTLEGRRYPSITTVLGILGEEDIRAWKERVGEEEAKRVGRFAAGRGEDTHLLVERHLKNEEIEEKGIMPMTLASFKQVRRILDRDLTEVYLQESPLYSDFLGVAGRVDIVGKFRGKRSIVDIKTSGRIKNRDDIESYYCQESGYAIMTEERTGFAVEQLVTVMAVDYLEPIVFIEHRDTWAPKLIETIRLYKSRSSRE